MYSLKNLITRDTIEEELSEEEIFEFYLYPVNFNTTYLNPFREDNHPDAKYYINKNSGTLYFIDPSWDNKHYSCYSVVMEIYKCTFQEALVHIYEDMIEGKETSFSIEKIKHERIKKENISPTVLKIKSKHFTKEELEFWNIGGLVLTEQELNENGIYSVETLWENTLVHDNLKFCFAYIDNGIVVQIYFPLRKKGEGRRFINKSGYVFSNQNKIKDEKDVFVLTKSNKCRMYLNKFGIPSEYNINEAVLLDSKIYGRLKKEYKHIFSLFDNDRQGKHAAWKHRKEYGITPLFIPKEYGKDFSEMVKNIGYQSVIDLIEETRNKLL